MAGNALDDLKLRKREIIVATIAVVVTAVSSIAALVVSTIVTNKTVNRQLDSARAEFHQQFEADTYDHIVESLASDSEAVQINASRRLTQYVLNPAHFAGPAEQEDEIINAVQTVQAYVKQKSLRTARGLNDWSSPPNDAMLRAAGYSLRRLLRHGDYSVDLGGVDLHGASIAGIRLTGDFLTSIDLRRANLLGANLAEADVRRAFLTCANLSASDLSKANLEYTDLTGANLAGANLRAAENLTPSQLHHVTYDSKTVWPSPTFRPPGDGPWGVPDCVKDINTMTGRRPGQGYDPDLPLAATKP